MQVDGQLAEAPEPPYAWEVTIGKRAYAVELGEELTVDGEPVDLEMEYTPGDTLVRVEITKPAHPELVEGSSFSSSQAASSEEKNSPSTGSGRAEVVYGVKVAVTRTGFKLTTRGAAHTVRVLPAHVAPLARHMLEKVPPDLSKFLICPMPGLLVALHVGEGDAVQPGQPLAVVEAMKMENILRAEKAGRVKKLNAAQGESLAVDAVILEME
jgi:propionyl-CoA carboxylase alpha chain